MSGLRHGMFGSPEYKCWDSVVQRCENPRHASFADYGGRGIKVCRRWRSDFMAFFADMGPRPRGKSLDRIDNDKGYEPGNCRWASNEEQRRNRRDVKRYSFRGRELTIGEFSAEFGVPFNLLWRRVKDGWAIEKAITTPKRSWTKKQLSFGDKE